MSPADGRSPPLIRPCGIRPDVGAKGHGISEGVLHRLGGRAASREWPKRYRLGSVRPRRPRPRGAAHPMLISWVALALMTTSSVASLRPAPSMAVYGLGVFLYLIPR